MTLTTNRNPIKEKLGTPEGEFESRKANQIHKKVETEERLENNEAIVSSVKLSKRKEYIVSAKKSPDKKDKVTESFESSNKKESLNCPICDFKLESQTGYDQHIKEAHPERPKNFL